MSSSIILLLPKVNGMFFGMMNASFLVWLDAAARNGLPFIIDESQRKKFQQVCPDVHALYPFYYPDLRL